MSVRVIGIVGSYRKGGIIDSLVSETLAAAEEHGAETTKIYLLDAHVEFCTNCRSCTQEPGIERGKCIHDDEMVRILDDCDKADAIVLGAPVNFFNVNAITRRFMERTLGYTYWPWGTQGGPMLRTKGEKKAVLITSAALPAFLVRFVTGAKRALNLTAKGMGAKPVAWISAGMIAKDVDTSPPASAVRKARKAGRKIARG